MGSLGVSHNIERITDDGLFSADILIEDDKVIVEVDGPHHFTVNTHQPLGMQSHGGRVLHMNVSSRVLCAVCCYMHALTMGVASPALTPTCSVENERLVPFGADQGRPVHGEKSNTCKSNLCNWFPQVPLFAVVSC